MTIPNSVSDFSDPGSLEQWLRALVTHEARDAAVEIDDYWLSDGYVDLHLRRGERAGGSLRVTRADADLASSDPTHITERVRQLATVL